MEKKNNKFTCDSNVNGNSSSHSLAGNSASVSSCIYSSQDESFVWWLCRTLSETVALSWAGPWVGGRGGSIVGAGECDWCGCLIHSWRISFWLTDDTHIQSSVCTCKLQNATPWYFRTHTCYSMQCYHKKRTCNGDDEGGNSNKRAYAQRHCKQSRS